MKDAIAREKLEALVSLLAERDRRYTERFDAQEAANQLALSATEKAVLKAEAATGRQFESVNEFRSTLSDQASQFVTRKEVEALLGGVNATLGRLEKSDATTAGRGSGIGSLLSYAIAAAGVVIAAMAIMFK